MIEPIGDRSFKFVSYCYGFNCDEVRFHDIYIGFRSRSLSMDIENGRLVWVLDLDGGYEATEQTS